MGHFVCILAVRKDVERGSFHRKHFRVWHDHPELNQLKTIYYRLVPEVTVPENKALLAWRIWGGNMNPQPAATCIATNLPRGESETFSVSADCRRSPSDRLGNYTTKGQGAFPREEIETTWSVHVCFKVNFQGEKTLEYGKVNWDSRLEKLARVSFSKMCWSCFHHAQMRHV